MLMDIAAVRDAYRRYAKVYDIVFGGVFALGRRRVIREVNRRGGLRVLEVGVGTGLSLPAYRSDNRIVGIDVSPEMLEIAERRVAKHGLGNVESLHNMDAAALTFPDGSFDVVVAMFVMPVVPDPEGVMAELRRVCKPGGYIYIVNHFQQETPGLRYHAERILSHFSNWLGWHADYKLKGLLDIAKVELTAMHVVPPFGWFRLLEFRNVRSTRSDEGWEPSGEAAATGAQI